MPGRKKFSDLIEDVYDAAMDPARWNNVVVGINEFVAAMELRGGEFSLIRNLRTPIWRRFSWIPGWSISGNMTASRSQTTNSKNGCSVTRPRGRR